MLGDYGQAFQPPPLIPIPQPQMPMAFMQQPPDPFGGKAAPSSPFGGKSNQGPVNWGGDGGVGHLMGDGGRPVY